MSIHQLNLHRHYCLQINSWRSPDFFFSTLLRKSTSFFLFPAILPGLCGIRCGQSQVIHHRGDGRDGERGDDSGRWWDIWQLLQTCLPIHSPGVQRGFDWGRPKWHPGWHTKVSLKKSHMSFSFTLVIFIISDSLGNICSLFSSFVLTQFCCL